MGLRDLMNPGASSPGRTANARASSAVEIVGLYTVVFSTGGVERIPLRWDIDHHSNRNEERVAELFQEWLGDGQLWKQIYFQEAHEDRHILRFRSDFVSAFEVYRGDLNGGTRSYYSNRR